MKADKAKKSFARQLRKNSTDAERLLWSHLRDGRLAECRFRRQQPIGAYVPDFVCFERRLIVELDGGQHAAQQSYDTQRDDWLRQQGFRVLRFPDNVVLKEVRSVLEVIWKALEMSPSPPPSPIKGEG